MTQEIDVIHPMGAGGRWRVCGRDGELQPGMARWALRVGRKPRGILETRAEGNVQCRLVNWFVHVSLLALIKIEGEGKADTCPSPTQQFLKRRK
jgi:hypothetical protein